MNIFSLRIKLSLSILAIFSILLGGISFAQATNPGFCDEGGSDPNTCELPPVLLAWGMLSASPNPITQGNSTTLTWSCEEMTGFTFNSFGEAVFSWSSNFGANGSTYPGGNIPYGTTVVSPSEATTYTFTCNVNLSGGGGTFHTVQDTVLVNAIPSDVYAGSTGPTTATLNEAVTLSSTVTNQGAGAATNFPNVFQISGIGYVAAQTLTVASGGSSAISAPYTFTSAGSYSVRACADKNTDGNGLLTESDEDNNCNATWTTVTVYEPTGVSLSASPTGVYQGSSTTLSWSSTSATSCIGTGFSTGNATSGSVSVTPASSTTYSIECTGPVGSATDSELVTVSTPVPGTPTGLLASCSPGGTSVNLSWDPTSYAVAYYIRITPTNGGSCPAGFQVAPWDSSQCIPNPDWYTSTSISNYSVSPNTAYTMWVYAANGAGYSATPGSVSFNCAGQADLTSTTGSGATILAGGAFTASATIRNIGTGSTGVGFENILQVCNVGGSPLCNIYYDKYAVSANTLAAGASQVISRTTTLNTAGAYNYRYCADADTLWNSTISESDEDHNCGDWVGVTVNTNPANNPQCSNTTDDDGDGSTDYPADLGCSSPDDTTESPNPPLPPSAPTVTLTSNKAEVLANESFNLTWGSSGATSCSGSGLNTGGATSGTVGASTQTTQIYGVTCTGAGGSTTAYRTVTVRNPNLTISSSMTRVGELGDSVTVTWNATDVDSCSITGPGLSVTGQAGPTVSGSQSVVITKRSTYTISCTSASGTFNKSMIVNVPGDYTEF